jgi:hypothetical protein
MPTCKHCGQIFETVDKPKGWMANHSRWCESNPKISQYVENLKSRIWENVHSKEAEEKRKRTVSANAKLGKYKDKNAALKGKPGKKHTQESKKKISEAALKSKHRRLRKNPIDYNGVTLDSSWELELAKRLDFLEIEWIRPGPVEWKDNDGVIHNYFPDFYLPKFNLYLDPKNQHAVRVQAEKLKVIRETVPNLKIIETLRECKEFEI